ncbi:hypothetical protein EB796_007736 [Bugula neritina]|uniref:Uncharacterized protein n=1 Tax=Bugula neritina TaxID=10212 RepID=A0A7J7K5R1_BUGNE|nr:hypothetical protein EB796_007736 [Bugula neritina]
MRLRVESRAIQVRLDKWLLAYRTAPHSVIILYISCDSNFDYVVALRKLSVHCNFGSQWEQRMRNRLVSGVKDDKIRNRLLSEGAKLTWERAVEIGITADVQNNYTMRSSSVCQ